MAPLNIAARNRNGRLTRQALLNETQRIGKLKEEVALLFSRLQKMPVAERKKASAEARAGMRKRLGVNFGPAEEELLRIAIEKFPAFSASPLRLSEVTGMADSNISYKLQALARRKKLNHSQVRGEFQGLMKADQRDVSRERSKAIRKGLATKFGIGIDEVNAIILEPLLKSRMMIARISDETGIGRSIIRLHDAKLSGRIGKKTKQDAQHERWGQNRAMMSKLRETIVDDGKMSAEETVAYMRERGFDTKPHHVARARDQLAKEGRITRRSPIPPEVFQYLRENPEATPTQVSEHFKSSEISFSKAARARKRMIANGEIPSLMPVLTNRTVKRRPR